MAQNTKLKHSLSAKKKVTHKLKNILAQPFPKRWPRIDSDDFSTFKNLIETDQLSFHGTKYLQHRGIKLGLSSCLRNLKNRKASCVLLSTNIKPSFIVTQIINYAHNIDNTKVLCVPNLSELTEEMFKVKSLSVTFLKNSFTELDNWFETLHQKFKTIEPECQSYKSVKDCIVFKEEPIRKKNIDVSFEKLYLMKENQSNTRIFIPQNAKNLKSVVIDEGFSGDFISFSSRPSMPQKMKAKTDTLDLDTEKQILLSFIKKKTDTDSKVIESPKSMDIDESNKDQIEKTDSAVTNKSRKRKKIRNKDCTKNEDTKISYIPIKVNKIQGNPNKKKKNKNKKKK